MGLLGTAVDHSGHAILGESVHNVCENANNKGPGVISYVPPQER
jgi:hypothetical protein